MLFKTKFEKALSANPAFWKLVKRMLLANQLTVHIAAKMEQSTELKLIALRRKGLNKKAKRLKEKVKALEA